MNTLYYNPKDDATRETFAYMLCEWARENGFERDGDVCPKRPFRFQRALCHQGWQGYVRMRPKIEYDQARRALRVVPTEPGVTFTTTLQLPATSYKAVLANSSILFTQHVSGSPRSLEQVRSLLDRTREVTDDFFPLPDRCPNCTCFLNRWETCPARCENNPGRKSWAVVANHAADLGWKADPGRCAFLVPGTKMRLETSSQKSNTVRLIGPSPDKNLSRTVASAWDDRLTFIENLRAWHGQGLLPPPEEVLRDDLI